MSLHESTPAIAAPVLSAAEQAEAQELSADWLRHKERSRVAEDVLKDAKAKMEACKAQLAQMLGDTGKEGRRIGTYRVTNVRRTRQDIDRSVLKAEHPDVYASVLKVTAWEQLAVEYMPDVVVTPPVPEMWHPPTLEPSDPGDYPF